MSAKDHNCTGFGKLGCAHLCFLFVFVFLILCFSLEFSPQKGGGLSKANGLELLGSSTLG